MKRALVTGASGFVGRHLTKRLQVDGWQLRTLGRQPVVADHVVFDLATQTPEIDDLEGIDTVFHLAAWQPGNGPVDLAQTLNVNATERLGRLAARVGIRRFVFVSSTAAMGNACGNPIDETTLCAPKSHYEVSKYEAEQALMVIDGLDVVILRPPLIAGPGQSRGAIPKMFDLCRKGRFPTFGGRTDMTKPLVHVADLVDAICLAALEDVAGETFIVTSGASHSLDDILRACARLVERDTVTLDLPLPLAQSMAAISTQLFRAIGRESPLSTARLALYLADRRFSIEKARRLLGYRPKITDTMELLQESLEC